jgi:hypothetical protein
VNYVDYEYYVKTFVGDGKPIPRNEFEKYATKASNKVRNRILNKDISLFETEIKNVTCSIVDILYNQYLNKKRLNDILSGSEVIISSEKVGDYSRNISNVSITDLEKICSDEYINEQVETELEDYLLSTGLLYCGVQYV